MKIQMAVVGRVINSDKENHLIRIENDAQNTGGFLIFEKWVGSDGPNTREWFDSWIKDEASIERFIAESGWEIEWSNKNLKK